MNIEDYLYRFDEYEEFSAKVSRTLPLYLKESELRFRANMETFEKLSGNFLRTFWGKLSGGNFLETFWKLFGNFLETF